MSQLGQQMLEYAARRGPLRPARVTRPTATVQDEARSNRRRKSLVKRHEQIAASATLEHFTTSAIRGVLELWSVRRCWICSKLGPCKHREPLVDLAEIEAIERHNLETSARTEFLRTTAPTVTG